MKRFVAGSLCTGLLFLAGSAHAQWESGATLITVNLGYATAKSDLTAEQLHGGSLNGDLEFAIPGKPISFGLAAAHIVFDENEVSDGESIEIGYNSSPVYGTIKAWFGGPRFRGYLGLGLGFHTSKIERSRAEAYRIETSTGFAMEVPAGAILLLGDKVFLHGGIALHVLGDSFYDSNIAGMVNAGLGFKLADW
jgi:hypothetical protein